MVEDTELPNNVHSSRVLKMCMANMYGTDLRALT